MEENLTNVNAYRTAPAFNDTAYTETRLMLDIIGFLDRLDDGRTEESQAEEFSTWLAGPLMQGSPVTGRQALERFFE